MTDELEEREEWLRRWQEDGDHEALDRLLQAEVEALRRHLNAPGLGASASPATQEDVAQDAVFRLLRADPQPQFETPAALRAYLWTAAQRRLIDHLRRRRVAPLEPNASSTAAFLREPSTSGQLSRVDQADLQNALWLTVNLLAEHDAEILRLVYFEGRSITSAGEILGIGKDAANTRLVRARVRLASKLVRWKELIEG